MATSEGTKIASSERLTVSPTIESAKGFTTNAIVAIKDVPITKFNNRSRHEFGFVSPMRKNHNPQNENPRNSPTVGQK